MLATLVRAPFDRDGWIFEIKWDGYRAIADVEGGDVALYSRRGEPFELQFPPIYEALKKLRRDVVLDGEIVMLDDAGLPSFQGLQQFTSHGERGGQLVYYLFDLLSLDGQDLRALPLTRRKELLSKLSLPSSRLRVSEHVDRVGVDFFQIMVERNLEGMIAKKGTSPYREGVRSYDWLKIKTRQRQEAVIAGFTKPRGSRQGFGAVILGVYEAEKLVYIGHSGSGFDTRTLLDLHRQLLERTIPKCPFAKRPKTNAPATWVRPELVCEVAFHGWTSDGVMRQPIFMGLRVDKTAQDVHRELPKPTPPAADESASSPKKPGRGGNGEKRDRATRKSRE